MNRIGTGAPVDPGPSLGHFPLRRVTFREFGPLLRASVAPFRVAPLRLTGLFLLLSVPIAILTSAQVLGPFLGEVAGAVAFTAYTAALDAAGRSEPPDFRQLAVVLRFAPDKMLLLMLSGLLPVLVAVLAVSAVWGLGETGAFLNEMARANGHPSPVMSLDFRAVDDIASIPFTFVAPIWALYRWSGSRSMAANLLACLVNWRWVLALAGFAALTENLLVWLLSQGGDLALLSQISTIVLQMLELSWTLALAQRSLPAR